MCSIGILKPSRLWGFFVVADERGRSQRCTSSFTFMCLVVLRSRYLHVYIQATLLLSCGTLINGLTCMWSISVPSHPKKVRSLDYIIVAGRVCAPSAEGTYSVRSAPTTTQCASAWKALKVTLSELSENGFMATIKQLVVYPISLSAGKYITVPTKRPQLQ